MKFIIVAGGTGGHIFPALSLIDKIMENEKNEVLYIGTTDRMESEIVPSKGIPYKGINVHGIKKNLIKDFKNIFDIRSAVKECKKIISEFKPDAVVAFGGYVTFPVALAAHKLKVPVFLHEQNVIPGKTNKLLCKLSKKVFISFKESEKYFKKDKVIYSGNPCLERAKNIERHSKTKLGFEKNKKLILIVMGSEGSTAMNEILLDYLRGFNEDDKEILFITGRRQYNDLNNNLKVPSTVKLMPFYDDLPGLMKSADLIISRAGASTISEIIGTSIPSILIPSPYVANNHQYYNALSLKEQGISIMIEQKDFTKELLEDTVRKVLDNKEFNKELKDKLEFMEKPNPSTIMYNEILKNK
jgi:UDP-N-acetylglucosamine--N-acetylmuramyl-(pentapeptide) pyrophosphoryl-undecaprenol N-acetylglucosamine transferase